MNSNYTPKTVSATTVNIQNLIATRQVSFPVSLAGEKGQFALISDQVERSFNLFIHLVVNQIPLSISVDSSLLDWYLVKMDAGVGFVDLPDNMKEATVIPCVNDMISSINDHFSASLNVTQVSLNAYQPPDPCVCYGLLTYSAGTCALKFSVGQEVAMNFQKLLSGAPQKPVAPPESLPLTFKFEAGRTYLTQEAYHSLELFDVVVFDHTWEGLLVISNMGHCFTSDLTMFESDAAPGSQVYGVMKDEKRLSREQGISRYEVELEDAVKVSDVLPSVDTSAGNTVLITFDVAQVQVPVEEVKKLTKGYVFSIVANYQAPVNLMVNGQCIGTAEFVLLGEEKFGAKILSLHK